MTLENNLEKLIQDSFLNYFTNQELTDLTAKFTELHKQGYQIGFIESISGDIEQWDIKNVSQPIKWFNQTALDITAIIANEKQAAIRLQHFEYAAQLTILVTHFRDLKTPLKSYNGHTIPAIESLLADSGGWIVYPHHLESLFRMTTGRSCKEAIAFRNNINKKNINGYEPFLDTPICGTSIGKLLQERMLTEFVLYPDYHTANLLFDYLN